MTEVTPTKRMLRPSEIATDYRSAYRAVAYLLRAFVGAVRRADVGDYRLKNLPAELTNAIAGEHAAGDTASVWLSRLAQRWDVVLADVGDESSGVARPLTVWFPEGRAAWDVVCARVFTSHLDRIVEDADQLANFALRYGPREGRDDAEVEREIDDAVLDVPAPASVAAAYVPPDDLVGDAIEPARWRALWTLEGAFAHGADERNGNVVGIRRRPLFDRATGEHAEVPAWAGNAGRGAGRRLLAGHLVEALGIDWPAVKVPVAHSLLDGGTLQGSSQAVDADLRRGLRALLPMLDLYGCNWNRTDTMEGWLTFEDAMLVCAESAWMFRRWLAPDRTLADFRASLRPASEHVTQQQLTSQTEELADPATKVLARVEVVKAGSLFAHRVGLAGRGAHGRCPEVTRACLAMLLRLMRTRGVAGAAGARGNGRVLVGPYVPSSADVGDLPSPDLYTEHLLKHRDAILDLLLAERTILRAYPAPGPIASRAAPAEPEGDAKPAKRPAKGRKGAKPEADASLFDKTPIPFEGDGGATP